ncbi:hypothetical protein PSU4_29800 [Pseudonocardia sulfidoxydans NBRC 16205]|uniref:Endolytic murein transglycosylase n=1 Tax=Pseudonocardia sulfidoxydans NBRC 16205 TaxID=1223511 RepID=A0A511DGW5_9PSEU|nr:endolytic transglycosylase MltG [Pseudonocardia sulfidoxydans]GEL24026.1 hypothetical protein PSU4_29800 [Pseudonocardia sulfidoxydans NBRC 16205]
MTGGMDGHDDARPPRRVPGRGERDQWRDDTGWAPPPGPRRVGPRGDDRRTPGQGEPHRPARSGDPDQGRRGAVPPPGRRRRPENETEQRTDRVPAVRRNRPDDPSAPRTGGRRRAADAPRDPGRPRRAPEPVPPPDAVAETVRARHVRPRRSSDDTTLQAAATGHDDPYDSYDAPVRSSRSSDSRADSRADSGTGPRTDGTRRVAAAASATSASSSTTSSPSDDDARVGPRRTAGTSARTARREAVTRRRRRIGVLVLAAVVLLGVVGGGAYVVGSSFFDKDYDGTGTGDVIVQVVSGDSTSQIGQMLTRRGVVASSGAFTGAAADDARILAIQPGYYQMSGQMSAESAVARLVDPAARVGRLEVRGGTQLDDTRSPDGATAPGVISLISQASCGQIDGQRRCVSVDDLRSTMEQTDPGELGAPTWALEDIRKAEPARRFEGLVSPGIYDIAPGTAAPDVWRELLAASVPRLEAAGIGDAAARSGVTPYQALIISSLVEKEGITPDMPRVARVVYNRLAAGQRLELDSMVNYPLDVQALRTTAEARARVGPYNSYAVAGLPPTPIAAAGKAAMTAALGPEPGPWLFFVRCKPDGTSCFGTTLAEHQANIRQAIADGAI